MKNNDGSNMNTEDNNSLLKYSKGTSYSSLSSPVSKSEGVLEGESANQPPVQFESRRARRISETGLMPQVPDVTEKSEVVVKQQPIKTGSSTPNYSSPSSIPEYSSEVKAPKRRSGNRPSKDYWGGTAMMMSLLLLLVAQLLIAGILIIRVAVDSELLQKVLSDSSYLQVLVSTTPWLLLLGNAFMYLSWVSSMWWVTKYRSGVQKGKKFWNAFKDNFRLNNFKPMDIAFGAGIAVVMVGFQQLVLTGLPQIFPSLTAEFEAADNSGTFKSLDGAWFWVIGLGMVTLVGPICEELFFRGFLLRGFSNHYGYKNSGRNMDVLEEGLAEQAIGLKSMMVSYRSFTHKYRYVLAIIASSLLFGLVHFQGSWITTLMTGILGLVFAIVTIKFKKLYPAIFGHIFHNGIIFAMLALSM